MTEEIELEAILDEARKDLMLYTTLCDPKYQVGRVHTHLAKELKLVEAGVSRRLIVSIPPRHGKSRMISTEWPTWMMARHPGLEVVLASYSGLLATTHARKAKERVVTPEFQAVFPGIGLDPSVSAANAWRMTNGSSYQAVGIGGSLTGKGADLLIVDDPFKDFQEAHSPSQREKVWDWFTSVAYSRLTPTGVVVVIMTRWHQDDLVGRLLDPKRQADMREAGFSDELWEECCMSAIAHGENDPLGRAPGEALFPERYDVKRLRAIRAVIGAYQWAALYDGNPKPKSGNYISRDNIRKVSPAAVPWQKTHMRYWDLAVKETETSDFHAGARGCIGDDGTFFIVHIEHMHASWPKAKAKVKEHAEKEMILTGVEAVGAFDIAFVELRGACRPDVPLQKFSFVKDKLTRALPWFALADPEAGFKVAIVEGDWNEAFLSEIEEFPKGLHDDQVDAVSGLYQMLTSNRGLLLA